jgi:hypothetical protein
VKFVVQYGPDTLLIGTASGVAGNSGQLINNYGSLKTRQVEIPKISKITIEQNAAMK